MRIFSWLAIAARRRSKASFMPARRPGGCRCSSKGVKNRLAVSGSVRPRAASTRAVRGCTRRAAVRAPTASGSGVGSLGLERARLAHLPLAVFQAAEEAALVALMADARTLRLHLDEHGIAVAIGGDFLDHEAVAGAFALEPQLAAGAAPEGGKTGFDGLAKGFLVHEADHEDASAGMILDDGGDEAV